MFGTAAFSEWHILQRGNARLTNLRQIVKTVELVPEKRFHAAMLPFYTDLPDTMQPRKSASSLIAQTTYAPANFFDYLRSRLQLPTDSALARHLMITPSALSRMRSRQLAISPEVLLKVHDHTCIPIKRLRMLMGDGRRFFS